MTAAVLSIGLVWRLTHRATDTEFPFAILVPVGAVMIALIVVWGRRLDRQAQAAGRARGAVFACSTIVERVTMRDRTCVREEVRRLQRPWNFRRVVWGKLFVSVEGVAYEPNAWSRAVHRTRTVAIPWDEIVRAAAVPRIGKDKGMLEITTADGASISFSIDRRSQAATALATLWRGWPSGGTP